MSRWGSRWTSRGLFFHGLPFTNACSAPCCSGTRSNPICGAKEVEVADAELAEDVAPAPDVAVLAPVLELVVDEPQAATITAHTRDTAAGASLDIGPAKVAGCGVGG